MSHRPGFEALAPFFRIIAEGLSGFVDGEDFFDTLAEDAIFEYVVSVPGYPRRVIGREAVAELYRGYGEMIVLHGSDELAVHHDRGASVVVLEYAVHGLAVSTGHAYDNHFVSIITIKDRKVTHWRDYLDPVAVFDAVGWPAPQLKADEADRPTLAIACERPADPFRAAEHTLPAECRPARQAACHVAGDQFALEPELAVGIAGSVTRGHRNGARSSLRRCGQCFMLSAQITPFGDVAGLCEPAVMKQARCRRCWSPRRGCCPSCGSRPLGRGWLRL